MNPEEWAKTGERVDDLQRCGLKILQDPERFCFGMDAVLLSAFVKAKKGDRLLDLGTGTGILPLLLSAKTPCAHLTGLELQEESADMARRSVAMNALEDKIDIVTGDLRDADRLFPKASFDVVTSNPPYMIEAHGIVNPADTKAIARHELFCNFRDVAQAAAAMLKEGGHFYLVHRPFRLAEILTTLSENKLEPKRMRLVYPSVEKEPNMVLIESVRGANARMTVEKPLILAGEDGEYTPEVKELYGF